jgi:hypothetical protein
MCIRDRYKGKVAQELMRDELDAESVLGVALQANGATAVGGDT